VPRIEDYALIGDMQTAALVARDGSIDWMCLPRFDSDACFSALLGGAGSWQLGPSVPVRSIARRYRPHTLILETELTTDGGLLRVTDFMPPREQAPDVVRIVECVRGQVPVRSRLALRFGYGRVVPWIRGLDGTRIAYAGPDAVYLRSSVEHDDDLGAEVTLSAGQRETFVITWHPSHLAPPRPVDPAQAERDTECFWKDWCARYRPPSEYPEEVLSSLITLKALTYSPTGGILAAATTSLPERIGGVRNWDYRFCWLRDATFTLSALLEAGYEDEARAWRDWLLRAIGGAPSQLQVMYGPAGERRLTEIELDWLPGYEQSKPVRIGNAAVEQYQLDVYGEVIDCLHYTRESDRGVLNQPAWLLARGLAECIERDWQKPDRGLWEVRGPDRPFTHSRVMAWVGIDRVLRFALERKLDAPVARWRALRDRIFAEVCEQGYDRRRNCFTLYYGSRELDAALLLLPLVGFLPARDERVRGTVAAIERELCCGGFVRRYSRGDTDGLPHGEGAFLACTFWLADNYALAGRHDEARRLFERLLALRNDVGLLAEEWDPDARRMLGNFPQAFSHVALVNTACNLAGRNPAHRHA